MISSSSLNNFDYPTYDFSSNSGVAPTQPGPGADQTDSDNGGTSPISSPTDSYVGNSDGPDGGLDESYTSALAANFGGDEASADEAAPPDAAAPPAPAAEAPAPPAPAPAPPAQQPGLLGFANGVVGQVLGLGGQVLGAVPPAGLAALNAAVVAPGQAVEQARQTFMPDPVGEASLATSRGLTDQELKDKAKTPEGKAELDRLTRGMNDKTPSLAFREAEKTQEKTDQIARLGKVTDPGHANVLDGALPPGFEKALADKGLSLQKMGDGTGRVRMDNYSVTVDKMPPGMTPEQFLEKLATNPNAAIPNKGFKDYADFSRRGDDKDRPSQVGDVFDIQMGPLESGPVAIRDKQSDRFTVSTVTDEKAGNTHPINGNREFGFTKNEDGSTTFYTRAADRRQGPAGLTGANEATAYFQNECWENFTKGVADQITADGGTVRPNSRTAETWDAGSRTRTGPPPAPPNFGQVVTAPLTSVGKDLKQGGSVLAGVGDGLVGAGTNNLLNGVGNLDPLQAAQGGGQLVTGAVGSLGGRATKAFGEGLQNVGTGGRVLWNARPAWMR